MNKHINVIENAFILFSIWISSTESLSLFLSVVWWIFFFYCREIGRRRTNKHTKPKNEARTKIAWKCREIGAFDKTDNQQQRQKHNREHKLTAQQRFLVGPMNRQS